MNNSKLTCVGLDISPSSTGVVILPPTWQPGDWNVKSFVVGRKLSRQATEEERADRLVRIVYGVNTALLDLELPEALIRVFIEGYAFSQALMAHTIAEVGGCIRLDLRRQGIKFQTINMGTARKFAVGKLPRAKVKDYVVDRFKASGCPFATTDEIDAFVVASFGRSELGLPALTLA